MTWVKIDDAITEHPKFLSLSPAGWTMWLHGIAYCSRNLSDGRIPKPMLQRLSSLSQPKKAAAELVAAGLWHESDDAYQVHDYLDHQRSRAQVNGERAAAAERQRKHREGKSQSKSRRDTAVSHDDGSPSVTQPETETETETDVTNPPTPLPIVPSVDNRSASHGHYPYDDRPAVTASVARLHAANDAFMEGRA